LDEKRVKEMKETGKIVQMTDRSIVIETDAHEACTKCCSCQASEGKQVTLDNHYDENLSVGDKVEIEISPVRMVRVYLLLYAFPLTIFVGGVFAAYFLTLSPIISFIAGMAATILSYIVISRQIKKRDGFSSEITVKKVS